MIANSDTMKLDVRDQGIFAKSAIKYDEIILELRGRLHEQE